MKPQFLPPSKNRTQAIALVIVLSMLVLLSGLLVAFMTSARTERSAAFANAGVTSARQVSDSTVSFVISQIRDATTSPDERVTWASQPGAIRTFSGTLSGTKKPLKNNAYYDGYTPGSEDMVYKLYSADRMKVSSSEYTGADLPKETDVISAWDRKNPAEDYVDLNEPAMSRRIDLNPDGSIVEPHYPVIDPRAALDKNGAQTTPGAGIVEGFDAQISEDENLKMNNGNSVPYLPLPVRWLYVFRDGTIGPASLGTEDNPIVGRTAFWTDDESCKLNINTASEGTFWDTPHSSTMQECGYYGGLTDIPPSPFGLNLAGSQPVRGEFQRYGGHPATTCLSPVLGWLWNLTPSTSVFPYTAGGRNDPYNKFKEAIYQISPFTPYGAGTSTGALRNTDRTATIDGSLNVSTKHLYASIDDLIFKQVRFSGSKPETNAVLAPVPADTFNDALEKTRFFLTANSRAPEINLYGRPRVTAWPVNADYKYRTPFDELFLFTSTIARSQTGREKKFCLLRGDAKSPTMDYVGNWNGSVNSADRGQNERMFKYLQDLTSRSVPGFGKTFADGNKWGGAAGRDEMLTLIFDYVRTVNLVDTGATSRTGNVFAPYTPKYFPGTPPDDQYKRYARSFDWSGQVTPLRRDVNDQYQGLGRFIIPSEVAVVFHSTTPDAGKTGTFMRATMLIEMATVMPGYPAIRETYWTKVIQKRPGKIQFANDPNGARDLHLCGDGTVGLINIPNISSHEIAQGRGFMPTLGFANAFYYFPEHAGFTLLGAAHLNDPNRNSSYSISQKIFDNSNIASKTFSKGNTIKYYPYVSDKIATTLPNGTKLTQFYLPDLGAYEIQIFVGEGPGDPRSSLGTAGGDRPVEVVEISFPQATPVPKQSGGGTYFTVPTTPDMGTRLNDSGGYVENPQNFIQGGDVVRSMQFTGGFHDATFVPNNKAGDLRLLAARGIAVNAGVPQEDPTLQPLANYYAPVDDLATYQSSTAILHRLTRGHGDPQTSYTGSDTTHGNLVAGATMRTINPKPPILPKNVNGVQRADGGPGDFDRGLAKHMDGAFGNKVDEGNLKFDPTKSDYTGMPYFRGRGIEETGQTFFTPNRQLPSAVMFGSLPTGVKTNQPWQTLLFRPNRENGTIHPGADYSKGPLDHLILDLFSVPVVEPYAISEPFSTAGKINLNYVIAPFGYAKGSGNLPNTTSQRTYLRRDTAIRGLLKSTMISLVPNNMAEGGHVENPQSVNQQLRYAIDLNKTIEAMETRLQAKADQYPLFRSASEICTVDLYPLDKGVSDWNTFWSSNPTSGYALTGDNVREKPYAFIYPRTTTKSNVYTVHMRCEAIKKAKGTKANEFDPKKDQVIGEYRGSATIERFVDPNDAALLDYNETASKVDPFYRYRIVNTKHFSPR